MGDFVVSDEDFLRGLQASRNPLYQDMLPRNDQDFSLFLLKLSEDEPGHLLYNSGFLLGMLVYSDIAASIRGNNFLLSTGKDDSA